MKFLSIFLSLITVSEGANRRPGYLTDYNLRIKDGETSTRIIQAHIGQKQSLVCPGDQKFSVFKVSKEDYRQCNIDQPYATYDCFIPSSTKEDIPKFTLPFEEITPTGEGEVHPGDTEYFISENCEIKIEIQIELEDSNVVETREARKDNEEKTDWKLMDSLIVVFSILSVTALIPSSLIISSYIRKCKRREQKRMQGESPVTDCSYQSSRDDSLSSREFSIVV